jgi:Tol biopolymer transport system component
MRVPLAGGIPEQVLTSAELGGIHCSAGGCILEEMQGGNRIIFVLDPMKGKGRELFRPPGRLSGARLSPDGKRIAMIDRGRGLRIHVLRLDGTLESEVQPEGVRFISTIDWAHDANGFYCGASDVSGRGALLLVDLKGKVRTQWQRPAQRDMWGIPSPDGKRIAVLGTTVDSNVWLMEDLRPRRRQR